MKLLLDTHTFLWLDTAPERLSPLAYAACADPSNALYLSVVSAWEIQIKSQLGRLHLDLPLAEMIDAQCAANGLAVLSVELAHVYRLERLPLHHNDPFDRLLLAQAQAEGMALVSADGKIGPYDVAVIW